MTDKPIMFGAPMVRAILDGRKTMTRRIVKPQPDADGIEPHDKYPRWAPRDTLWVRETWADVNTENGPALLYRADNHLRFCVNDAYPVEYGRYPGCEFTMWCGDLLRGSPGHSWRSPIFMPRWASRILLRVTEVKIERLHAISCADAIAEGILCGDPDIGVAFHAGVGDLDVEWSGDPEDAFIGLWEHVHGKDAWDANPWVAAISFERVA